MIMRKGDENLEDHLYRETKMPSLLPQVCDDRNIRLGVSQSACELSVNPSCTNHARVHFSLPVVYCEQPYLPAECGCM